MKFLHKLYANLFGYFWLPCPKCGEMFGGHQRHIGGAHVIVTEADGPHCYCVCPACDTPELRAENQRELYAQMAAWVAAMRVDNSGPKKWFGQGLPHTTPR